MDSLKHDLMKVIKKHRPTRKEFENSLRECRRDKIIGEIIGPSEKIPPRKLPKLPSMQQVQKLLDTMETDGNIKFRLMAKMFLYSGLRNAELSHIKTSDINLSDNRIFINQGKGSKDRYMIIFKDFRDLLVMYMNNNLRNIYLFENRYCKHYSDRYVRKVFQDYCKKADLPRIHPHMFRHIFITFLRKKGWKIEDIMLLSGHSDPKSVKFYDQMALPDIEEKFQNDMRGMGV